MAVVNLTEIVRNRKEFIDEVEKHGGKNVNSCYQCGKCSAGCPVSYAMDYQPRQVMRMVQLGMKDKVLSTSTIWLCAHCMTCTTRCPREVDIAGVMEALRMICRKENRPIRERKVPLFHDLFLDIIRKGGRQHEFQLAARYKIATGNLFQDVDLGRRMFFQGKLRLFGPKVKGAESVRKIFEKCKELEGDVQ